MLTGRLAYDVVVPVELCALAGRVGLSICLVPPERREEKRKKKIGKGTHKRQSRDHVHARRIRGKMQIKTNVARHTVGVRSAHRKREWTFKDEDNAEECARKLNQREGRGRKRWNRTKRG